jgi:FtsP/CotA-like multicopper oxidase with cupredoxin domain
MIRTNKLHVIRLSLLLLGVVVLLLTLTALLSSQAQASGEVQIAPAKAEAQPAKNINPRPQAANVAFDLCASDGTLTLPDSTNVTVWGFVDTGGGACTTGMVTALPGPELHVNAGDVVTINLTNALAENVSILIPGQSPTASGGTPGLFADEAAASGGTVSYSFTAQQGTYLYESGTNASIQVPMGLYGALIVDSGISGQAYGHVFDQEAVLLLSAIDPALNANPGGFDLLDYHPTYWLINGEGYPNTANISATPGDQVLLRYLNASFDHPSMALLGAYQRVIAKDSYTLNNPFDVVAETIPAGTTADMIVDTTGLSGDLPLYNRNMYVTNADAYPGGMLAFISIGPPVDQPPTVEAGTDQTINVLDIANLDGTVTDDGLSSLTTLWTQTSGPGSTTFGDANLVDTTATFSAAGSYVLRLTATDGTGSVFDEVTVTAAVDQPPTVNAGTDQSITLPDSASLDGTVSDDGLSTLTTLWTMESGPSIVTFGDDSLVDTTASFSVDGVYILRLTATDGTGSIFDEVEITVDPAPVDQPPTVEAGTDQEITLPASANLDGTVTDDGLSALTTQWSTTSGPGTVTFGDASLVDTTASFSTDGVYLLRLTATDGTGSVYDEVTVNVNPAPTATMHIGNLSGAVTNVSPGGGGGGSYTVTVTVTVHNASHGVLSGVTVSGAWTTTAGGFTPVTSSCVTNGSGQCTVQATHNLNPNNTNNNLTFTVNNLTLASYTYNAAGNDVSNSVTVARP